MKRMKRVRKCQGIFLVIIFKMFIPAVQKERWRGRFIRSSPAIFYALLLELFKPCITQEPLFVNLVVGAVVLCLDQEVVQPVDEVSVAFIYGPCQRLIGERLVEQFQFALTFFSKRNGVERQVVDECVNFAVEEIHNAFLLGLKRDVLAVRNHALGGLLAGGAEFGGDLVLLVVQVFVGSDGARKLLVDQDALANNDIGFGKADLHVAFLGQGHAAHDH